MHAQAGDYMIGAGVLRYMFVDKKKLNRTLVIDSPFQTFMVGLLIEFMDYSTIWVDLNFSRG